MLSKSCSRRRTSLRTIREHPLHIARANPFIFTKNLDVVTVCSTFKFGLQPSQLKQIPSKYGCYNDGCQLSTAPGNWRPPCHLHVKGKALPLVHPFPHKYTLLCSICLNTPQVLMLQTLSLNLPHSPSAFAAAVLSGEK